VLLVLADANDDIATGVARAATGAGAPWLWLTPADLSAARWAHRLFGSSVATRVVTADGRDLDLADATGVLNRLSWLPPVALSRPEDRQYAMAEQHALLTSVLASLSCPVVNPVRPPSLAGPMLDLAGWLAIATRCGIPTGGMRATTNGRRWTAPGWQRLPWQSIMTLGHGAGPPSHPSVPTGSRPVVWAEPLDPGPVITAVGTRVFGAPDPAWQDHARRLAAAAGCPLLQVTLGARGPSWVLVGVEPTPAVAPPAAAHALLDLLTGTSPALGTPT